MELYNKKLEITDETVLNETSVIKLIAWRNAIQSQIMEVKERLTVITGDDETIRANYAKRYMSYLAQLIDGRIKEVKAIESREV